MHNVCASTYGPDHLSIIKNITIIVYIASKYIEGLINHIF